jgi:hypothetical protein
MRHRPIDLQVRHLFVTTAVERNMSLDDVQKQQGELWRNRSFSGEWIEVSQDNNTWRWAQKP